MSQSTDSVQVLAADDLGPFAGHDNKYMSPNNVMITPNKRSAVSILDATGGTTAVVGCTSGTTYPIETTSSSEINREGPAKGFNRLSLPSNAQEKKQSDKKLMLEDLEVLENIGKYLKDILS